MPVKRTISIPMPLDLAISLKMDKEEFSFEIQKAALLKLYELGKVSSGMAAQVLGMSRIEFLAVLSKYNISPIDIKNESDIAQELRNA